MGVFLLILKILTLTDKSHFRIPQDYMDPEFNWVTYRIQLSLVYLFLCLHLPFLPCITQSTYHRKCPKCTVGGTDIIFLKTPGKFLKPQLIKRACQTPQPWSSMLRFHLESDNKTLWRNRPFSSLLLGLSFLGTVSHRHRLVRQSIKKWRKIPLGSGVR